MLRLKRFLAASLVAAAVAALGATNILGTVGAKEAADDWTPLFNGKDLSGWETWLGKPHKSVEGLDITKDAKGEYTENVGLNKDPKRVYTVVELEGKPAIRISGEIFGALTTQEEYGNYHLRLEFRWGEKKWAPRDKAARDSGLLYHCNGKHGAAGTFWMQSLECQIMEGDSGSFYSVAGPIVDVEGTRKDEKSPYVYKKSGKQFTGVHSRIVHGADYEKPSGEWNTVELLTVGGTSVHIINGNANMVLTNSRHKVGEREEPLTRGKIQLQSEGAEVYYRNIAIKPLSKIPDEYLR